MRWSLSCWLNRGLTALPCRNRTQSNYPDRYVERLEDRYVPASTPSLLKDIYPGVAFSDPSEFTDVNGVCFFAAYDGPAATNGHYRELWKSDGTTAGTVLVKDIYPGTPNGSDPQKLTAVGNLLYFVAGNGSNGRELWKSDGTDAGTTMVVDLTAGAGDSDLRNLTAAGGKLYFTFATAAAGEELWVSNGTAAGTMLVKDIKPGGGGSIPGPPQMIDFGGSLFFSADDGVNGYELWKSDGTTAGTVLVADVSAGTNFPSNLTIMGTNLFFSALTGVYKTTGAVGNFTQIHNGSADSMVNANGTLYFSKLEQTGIQAEIWKSDGSAAGTVLVKQLPFGNQGGFSESPGPLFAAGPFVAFSFRDTAHGFEPWVTDGTAAGTKLLLDINVGTGNSNPGLTGVATLDNFVYFSANDSVHGAELWRSDGTTSGTTLTLDINPGSQFGFNGQLDRVGNNLFFSGYDQSNTGTEPWIVRGSRSLRFKGNTDIAGRDSATGQIYVGKSNGSSFTTSAWATWSLGVTWADVQFGDFNGDGIGDIAGRIASTGQWYVGVSNGATAFTNTLFGAWSAGVGVTWADVRVGDFNGDGKDDIAGRWNQTGQWWIAQSTGSAFTNRYFGQWSSSGVSWLDVDVGDYDGDGMADVAGRIKEYGHWWVGQSTGSAFANKYFGAWSVTEWDDVRTGDFNGDGRTDVMGRLHGNGKWYGGISNGTAFANALWGTWSTGLDWTNVSVGDVNGDGLDDLVGRWNTTGQWWVAQSTGTSFQNKYFGSWTNSVEWIDVRIGDFNNDGRADMVGRIKSNGQWYVAGSNGTAFANQLFGAWSANVTWVDVLAAEFALG